MKETKATLANGCFWCTEAVFKRIKGVISVQSGYTGGTVEDPSYEDVTTDTTGHAESLQVTFDADVLNYETILDIFFATHDPTTLNRQGNDVGEHYRSAIFYHDTEQKKIAENKIAELEKSGKYSDPIVTEITAFEAFYPSEDYHKDYYDNNRFAPYCMFIIDPKVKKLLKEFGDSVKDEYKK